ncbi:MAG: sulfatase [Polyangiaceae bacterium]|nr:sulfatase [Polyangiaceae bacterium]
MSSQPNSATWVARAANVFTVGLLSSVAAAAWEARWVAAQTGAWLAAFHAQVGIHAFMGLGVSLLVLFASLFVHGARGPLAHLRAWLETLSVEKRALYARLGSVAAVLLLLAWVLGATLSTRLLGTESVARSAGVALSFSAIVATFTLGAVGVALAQILGKSRLTAPNVVRSWGLAAAGLVAGVLLFVFIGTTSGQGPSYQALGVFRRQELDLRAVGLLAMMGVAAYVVVLPGVARMAAGLLVVTPLLALGVFVGSASAAFSDAGTVRALERHAPLTKLTLAPLRKLTDRDADGFSAWFGGGDCNDQDPRMNPTADDLEGNHIDEDCSGRDAEKSVEAPSTVPAVPHIAHPPQIPKGLNVIVITVDTLRANLGYLGYARNVSPNLDKLAKKAVIYENAYSLASYTSKSLSPMLIGKYGSETDIGFRHFNKFGPLDRFVPERIQGKIRTLSVQAYWYFHEAGYGFERGFDQIDKRAAPTKHIIEGDQTSNGDELTDNALEVLKDPKNTAQPFYMWVHYVDPHAEYVPHRQFDFGHKGRERYDGEVAFVDQQIGRLLDYLEASGLMKNTAIVFTSDHGEAFGEHGMYRHGYEVWEELVRVPLLLYVPGVAPRRVKERRSIIDVAPTLLDLLDVPAPSGKDRDFMSGQSLLAELFLPQLSARPIFIDMSAGPYNEERQALIENDVKVIMSDGKVLGIYDLAKDSGEKNDLSTNPEVKEKALGRFKAFKKRLREVPLIRKED